MKRLMQNCDLKSFQKAFYLNELQMLESINYSEEIIGF